MADDQQDPKQPPSPPQAAADKQPGATPAEPLKGEVSRTEAPSAGASAAPPAATPPAAKPPAAKPAAPAAKPAAAEHAPKAAPAVGPPDPAPPADKPVPSFVTTLGSAIPGAVAQVSYYVGDWTIIVPVSQLFEALMHLRDAPDASFDLCSDVTAVDWPLRPERFDLVYCLYSTRHHHRIRVKARVKEHEGVRSACEIWPAANWLEREVYDMFGVNITGHPDRRRILMPEDWQGFPQRKDYPLEGPGELLLENPQEWLKLRQAREQADIE